MKLRKKKAYSFKDFCSNNKQVIFITLCKIYGEVDILPKNSFYIKNSWLYFVLSDHKSYACMVLHQDGNYQTSDHKLQKVYL